MTLTQSSAPTWTDFSQYDLSAYYVTHETQYFSGSGSLSGPIPSLERNGEKISANKYFLFSKGGVCMQGSGRLKSGELIGCVTQLNWSEHESIDGGWEYDMPVDKPDFRENIPFFYRPDNDAKTLIPFETVAVCSDMAVMQGTEICIPGIMAALINDPHSTYYTDQIAGKDDTFTVTDVGGALCSRHAIDIYIGEQEAYSNRISPTDRAFSAIMRLPDMMVQKR